MISSPVSVIESLDSSLLSGAMHYCRAVLPRTGLGNRLFPWARCRVFSFTNKVPMSSPRWAQLKVGPLVRGESDRRLYFDLFKPGTDEVRGIRRLRLQLFSRREEEDARAAANGMTVVKVFAGEQERFQPLNGWDQFLHDELRSITKQRWLQSAEGSKDVPIGIHVRMGDFTPPESDAELELPQRRVPLKWFADSLRVIREAVGYPVRAMLVSDGREGELGELLREEKVSLVRTGSAISDLLVLAKSKTLIASAGSSFGAWAAFLGQMPSIAHPQQSFDWFNLKNRHNYYVGGFDPTSPKQLFLDQVKRVFSDQPTHN